MQRGRKPNTGRKRVGAVIGRRSFLLHLGAFTLAPLTARARDFWGERAPDAPQDFIFGYGSLMNAASRARTAGRHVDDVPARISACFGYVRGWVVRARSGWTTLGLRRPREGEAPSTLNGTVFPVTPEDLAGFDRREGSYERLEVPRDLIQAAGWQGLPQDGCIWIYVPRRVEEAGTAKAPDADFPILQSYVDLVLEGALAESEAFAAETVASTFDWNAFWLNDREQARRPWAANPDAGRIDRILAATQPAAAVFPERLYGEPYAARHLLKPAEGAR